MNSTENATTKAPAEFLTPAEHYKIGISLAVLGNFLIAVSLNIQKFAHRKRSRLLATTDQDSDDDDNKSSFCAPGSYLRSGTWWVGITLMIFGEVGNFVAYGFAPASVVAPLGCVAVIANGAIAVLFNNESLRMQDIFGATFALVGGFLIVEFSQQADKILNAEQITSHIGNWQFIIYVVIELVVLTLLLYVRSRNAHEKHSVMLHLLVVAILGSFTVISAKAVSGMLTITVEGETQLIYFIFYLMLIIMAITTIVQVKYLNQAMASYDIATVVPINFVLFTISAILAGAIFYQEFFHQPGVNIIMFLFGCSLSFLGVVFITWKSTEPGEVEEGALHLDMMPNFIRAFALSFNVRNVQPEVNQRQASCYPEDELPLLQSDSTQNSLANYSTASEDTPRSSTSLQSTAASSFKNLPAKQQNSKYHTPIASESD